VYGETNTTTEVNFLTIGVVLSVMPQISSDGTITLTIHPSVTDKTGEKTSVLGDVVPVVDVRETDTVVRLADRETIVIAGLMQNRVYENVITFPVLADIPMLGALFKHIQRETRKTELVIMLTPRIINASNMQGETAAENQRFEQSRDEILERKK
jgi:type II secretory pathway component GspD/PulD (secretin)